VNTLVFGPGKCPFADFIRVGIPVTSVVLAASVVLAPILPPQ
jgi:di/tricarboxylate transporter